MSLPSTIQKIYDYFFFSSVPWVERIVLYLFIGGLCLLALIFRKSVANEILDRPFSAIGGMILGIVSLVVSYHLLENLRYALGIGIVLTLVGGFAGGFFMPDGESE